MFKAKAENKGVEAPQTWPWQLLPEEREQLAAARAELKLKERAARGDEPYGLAATEAKIARRNLAELEDRLLKAVRRRVLVPEELR